MQDMRKRTGTPSPTRAYPRHILNDYRQVQFPQFQTGTRGCLHFRMR
jgi:hypothetical protein